MPKSYRNYMRKPAVPLYFEMRYNSFMKMNRQKYGFWFGINFFHQKHLRGVFLAPPPYEMVFNCGYRLSAPKLGVLYPSPKELDYVRLLDLKVNT